MAEIQLSNGGKFLVSDEDADAVKNAGNWFSIKKRYVTYVCMERGKRVYLHRFLMNPPIGFVVDHINGDGTDNRRENLRVATYAENHRNRAGAQRNSKTGIRGVYVHKDTGKYAAKIRHNKKNIHLGLFRTVEEAKAVRDAKAKELWSSLDNYRETMVKFTSDAMENIHV